MTPRLRRVVVSFLSQRTPRRGPLNLNDGVICRPNKCMPFSSGSKFSTVDLRIITPPLVSSNRNAHSTPYFTLSEKRALGVMTPEEVERRIDRIMRLASDAKLCIQDCREYIATNHFREELHFAKIAVDATGVAYSELLEELALSAEGVEVLNEVRKLYAPVLESLKQELNNISKSKDDDSDGGDD